MANWKHFFIGIAAGMVLLFTLLADTPENCNTFRENFVEPVTDARDAGIPPEVIFQQLVMTGFNPEGAYNLVQTVYVLHAESDLEEVVASFMNWCLGEDT